MSDALKVLRPLSGIVSVSLDFARHAIVTTPVQAYTVSRNPFEAIDLQSRKRASVP